MMMISVQDIPSTIGQLKSLVILNVDRNQLTAIPSEVSVLSQLPCFHQVICVLLMDHWFGTSLDFGHPGDCGNNSVGWG